MFEQLDDAGGFSPDETFFAQTSRRFIHRRRKVAALRIAGGTLCLAVGLPALFVAHRSEPNDRIIGADSSDGDTTPANETSAVTTAPSANPVDTFPVPDPTAKNFLIVGADTNACVDPSSPMAGGLAAAGHNGLTDTIMVVRIDPTTNRAAVLSFPRDLWVKIPGHGTSRINSAYKVDDPQLLIDTIAAVFGVPIDHFIQVDFCAFKKLVDAIDGVVVPVPYPLRDKSTGLRIDTVGCHTFAGDEALAYVRSRHIEYLDETGTWQPDPTSDLGRIARQQDFLMRSLATASREGVLQPKILATLYDTYKNDLVVDSELTIDTMLEFVGVLRNLQLADIARYQIAATPATISGNAVLVAQLDSPSMKAILAMFGGAALTTDLTTLPLTGSSTAIADEPTNNPPAAIVSDPTIEC
jgi:LCP family protein required for cell wall assembly